MRVREKGKFNANQTEEKKNKGKEKKMDKAMINCGYILCLLGAIATGRPFSILLHTQRREE